MIRESAIRLRENTRRALLGLALLGCAGDTEPFSIDYEGERVQVDANSQDFTCERNFELLDEQSLALEALWGREFSTKVRVSWSADPPDGCPGIGCYSAGIAGGPYSSLSHEIGHAYIDQAFPNSTLPSFLSEGLASSSQGRDLTRNMTLAELMATTQLMTDAEYGSAGHFIRWLIDEFGIEALADTIDRIDDPADETVLAALEEGLGLSIEEIRSSYDVSTYLSTGWGPFSCLSIAGPNMWENNEVSLTAELACSSSIGHPDRDGTGGYLWHPFRLDLSDGLYTFDGSNASFSLIHCAVDEFPTLPLGHAPGYWSSASLPWPWLPGMSNSVTAEVKTWSLEAGTYLLWVGRRTENDELTEAVSVQVTRDE